MISIQKICEKVQWPCCAANFFNHVSQMPRWRHIIGTHWIGSHRIPFYTFPISSIHGNSPPPTNPELVSLEIWNSYHDNYLKFGIHTMTHNQQPHESLTALQHPHKGWILKHPSMEGSEKNCLSEELLYEYLYVSVCMLLSMSLMW